MKNTTIIFLMALISNFALSAVTIEDSDGEVYDSEAPANAVADNDTALVLPQSINTIDLVPLAQANDVDNLVSALQQPCDINNATRALEEVTHYRIGNIARQERCIDLLASHCHRYDAHLAVEGAYLDLLLFNTYYNSRAMSKKSNAVKFTSTCVGHIANLLSASQTRAVQQRLTQCIKQGYAYEWYFEEDGLQGRDLFAYRNTGSGIPWKPIAAVSSVAALLTAVVMLYKNR